MGGEEYVGRAVKVSGLYFGGVGLGESGLNSVSHGSFLCGFFGGVAVGGLGVLGLGRGGVLVLGVLGGLGVHIVLGGLGVLGVDSCNARGVESWERDKGDGL